MSIAQNISLCHRHTQPTLSRFVHGRPLGQVTIIRVNTFGAWERQADSEKSPLPAPPSRCLSQFMPHLHESVPSASRGCGPSQSPFQRGAGTHCLRNICGGNSPLLHFPPITLPRESSPDPRFLDYSGLSLPGGHRCHPPVSAVWGSTFKAPHGKWDSNRCRNHGCTSRWLGDGLRPKDSKWPRSHRPPLGSHFPALVCPKPWMLLFIVAARESRLA